ncbi:hypothetical protein FB451DRAFT_1202137 [Mycena latifolia]|nr:hypothetical protein FB451DRAFT_1202137 [Mycena latifolia]
MSTTSADTVSVTARHTVRCADESSCNALDLPFRLGSLDQMVSPHIPISNVERLQRALTRLLDYYPQLTGRLQINSDTTLEITQLGTGAELLEAHCSEHLDALSSAGRVLLQNLPGAGNTLLAPFDQDQRVTLGVRILHTVCDAGGFFQVVQDLSELYRGIGSDADVPSLARPPHIRPYLTEPGGAMTPEERAAAMAFKPSLFYAEPSAPVEEAPPSPADTASFPPPPSPCVGRFLRFSSSELDALKAKATDPTSSGSWISTFDALSAHLHQRVYQARMQLRAQDAALGALSPPDFLTPVNIRSHIGTASHPPRYSPNALICTFTSFPPDVLATGPLWEVAKTLHDITRTPAVTAPDELDATLRWLAVQDMRQVRQGFRYGNGSLMLSQWNKIDMYGGAVFGAPPILVAPPFTPISLLDGLGYFLPTEEQGTIDVALALSEPIWAVMDHSV